MANQDKTNEVPLQEAITYEDEKLLRFIKQEAERLEWGQITIEANVVAGKINRIKTVRLAKTFNIG